MSTNAMSCDAFTDRLMAYLEQETDDATRVAMERHAVTCIDCGAVLAGLRKLRIDAANLPVMTPSRDLWSGIAARIEAPVVPIGAPAAPERVTPLWSRRPLRIALMAASLIAAMGIGYLSGGARRTDVAGAPAGALPEPATELAAQAPVVSPRAEPGTGREVASAEAPSALSTGSAPAASASVGSASAPAMSGARPFAVTVAVANLNADYDREIGRLRALIEQRRNQLDPVTVAVIEKNLQIIDVAITECRTAIARDPSSRFLIESLNQSLQTKMELMRTVAMLPSRT